MSHDFKLILTDIDGTILPYGQPCINERCRSAMHAALDAGICIGPASGRGHRWIDPLFAHDADLYATALATNGMQVMLKGEKVYEAFLDRNALVELAAWCHEEPGVGLICFEEMTPLLLEGTLEELNECFPRYAQEAQIAQQVPAGPTIKANVYITGSLERTHAIVDRLNRELPALTFDVPQPLWSNVTPHGWTKASGIDLLCELLGIGLDQVVVFGDGGNDVAMLQHVPCSVAVEGAAPEATQAARWHIGRCVDDAVPAAIEALVAGEFPFTS